MTFQWKIRYEVCRCMKSCSFHTLTASFVVFQWPPRQNTSKKWKTAGPHITKNMQIADDMKFETILRAPTCSWIKFLVPLRLYGWCTPDLHPAQPKPAFLGRRSGANGFHPVLCNMCPIAKEVGCTGGGFFWLNTAVVLQLHTITIYGLLVSMSLFQVEESSTLLRFWDSREADTLQKSCFVWK